MSIWQGRSGLEVISGVAAVRAGIELELFCLGRRQGKPEEFACVEDVARFLDANCWPPIDGLTARVLWRSLRHEVSSPEDIAGLCVAVASKACEFWGVAGDARGFMIKHGEKRVESLRDYATDLFRLAHEALTGPAFQTYGV